MKNIQNRFSYFLNDLIGTGAYSNVYKGKNIQTNEIVAIKVIDWYKVSDKYYIQGFQREIRIMADLNHKNIVKVYETLREETNTYIIMEYCDGNNLSLFIEQQGGKLTENMAKLVLIQVIEAQKELFQQGYLHRDIKPENILIHQGIIKLADFGFAIRADYTYYQLLSDCVGTPLYMSPQLLQNKHYSVKSDIWSIGILAFQLIAGEFPWNGENSYSLLKSIQTQPLCFLENHLISDNYKDFIINCLQFEEKDRINWEEVFTHKLFINENRLQNRVEKMNDAINQVKEMHKRRQTPITQLFSNLDIDGDKKLNFKEFAALLIFVNQDIELETQQSIFKLYNRNKTNLMNFDEFKRILQ